MPDYELIIKKYMNYQTTFLLLLTITLVMACDPPEEFIDEREVSCNDFKNKILTNKTYTGLYKVTDCSGCFDPGRAAMVTVLRDDDIFEFQLQTIDNDIPIIDTSLFFKINCVFGPDNGPIDYSDLISLKFYYLEDIISFDDSRGCSYDIPNSQYMGFSYSERDCPPTVQHVQGESFYGEID